MNNVMIDLETMSTWPDAAIVSIGAVEFDAGGIGEKFYEVVSLASSVETGGVIDADTVMWWLRQSDESRAELGLSEISLDLPSALRKLQLWMQERGEYKNLRVWGNGAGFDNVILSSAYRRCDIMTPWPHYGNMCYQTLKNCYPQVKMSPRVGAIHHKAVDDAEVQAKHLIEIIKHMKAG